MARVILIDADFVKKNSIIDDNVDVKLLRSVIWVAQREHIKPIIGTDLWEELQTAYDTGGSPTADEETLVNDYIANALLHWVVFEWCIAGHFKFRNKGIEKKNSDNAQPVDFTELRFLMDQFRNKAEMWTEDLVRFLNANEDLYPAYLTNSDIDDLNPRNTAYTTSVYLGDGSGTYCWRDEYRDSK